MAKVMMSIPDDLLADLDRAARARSLTRSALVQRAVRRELGRPDPKALREAVADVRTLFATAGPFEAAELVRDERRRDDA